MRIAVNTRLLLKNRLEGIGWFTYESFKRICTAHPEHEFFFIFDRKWDEDFIFSGNITPIAVPPQARHPLLYYAWFNYSIPAVLKKLQPHLFISPDGYLPLSPKTKTIAVFHDLNFEHYPKDLPLAEHIYYRRYFPRFAAKATRIGTVSEYSKNDISRTYNIDPQKIDVLYNGANESYRPVDEFTKTVTKRIYSRGKPYFLYVGALNPRKNLANLLKAFDVFRKNSNEEINLVVVGAKMWRTSAISKAWEELQFRDDVLFCGRLETDELRNVIGSALALTYVSYFEGFGIPIVEAFYCDTPVITSNVTSMPEVAGDAAMLVNPFSVNSIADAMHQVASSEDLRKSLVLRGRLRRREFSWQKTADRFWKTIEKTLE
ncbi:MAG: glycosyltransferase family 1 protein [Bacteroidales bacterium]|nr:glycosyltransferase family 1 protein [Bacteroidales bacterium]